MPFLLLLVVAVACLVPYRPLPPGGGPALLWAVFSWTPLAMVLCATFLLTRLARRLLRPNGHRETGQRLYSALRSNYLILFLALGYFLTLYGFGWGWVIGQLLTRPDGVLLPGAELLLLAPFVTALLLCWGFFYDVERAHHETLPLAVVSRPFWGRGAFVLFHARQNFALVAMPTVLLVFALGLLREFPQLHNDDVFQALSFGLVLVMFVCLPWVLRLILGLRPLPAGPLRDRLMVAARRLRFRCSDILLWNTHNGIANAMVVGVLPVPRYVVLSDRLLAGLSDDEVEAVFGHEVGHVKHYHMPFYLSFLLISVFVLAGVWLTIVDLVPELKEYLPQSSSAADLPLLPLVGLYIFVVFGFLSRRCERQADIYGCRAVSCSRNDCYGHGPDECLLPEARGLCPTGIQTFIQALEKVAYLNGISRSKPGWLHPTIAHRVKFLEDVLADRSLEPRFQNRVCLVKWLLLICLATLLGVLSATSDASPGPDAAPAAGEQAGAAP